MITELLNSVASRALSIGSADSQSRNPDQSRATPTAPQAAATSGDSLDLLTVSQLSQIMQELRSPQHFPPSNEGTRGAIVPRGRCHRPDGIHGARIPARSRRPRHVDRTDRPPTPARRPRRPDRQAAANAQTTAKRTRPPRHDSNVGTTRPTAEQPLRSQQRVMILKTQTDNSLSAHRSAQVS